MLSSSLLKKDNPCSDTLDICLTYFIPPLKTPLTEPSDTPKSPLSRTSYWEQDANGVWSSSKLILSNQLAQGAVFVWIRFAFYLPKELKKKGQKSIQSLAG